MAKELYCPECGTEYWGKINYANPIRPAVCGGCNHVFTNAEINLQERTFDFVKALSESKS